MILRIKKVGDNRTIDFAIAELTEYLMKMDSSLKVELSQDDDALAIGCSDELYKNLVPVEDKDLDDSIYIDVKDGKGIITGSNPRSVLIAVYRYLKELGCRFIRPGKDNEVIPNCNPMEKAVYVKEKASYRHREVCIEGAVSYQHVSDMIDWVPKISMNGYYIQFKKPYGFFKKYYQHANNPYMEDENVTDSDLDEITKKLEDEIAQRDLMYYAVGHSWTSEPFGIEASYWSKAPAPSEKIRPYLAMINGKRDWYEGVPMNTNLCYSNPDVQDIMTDDAVAYCKAHPAVKYLVIWLADSYANACECEECQKGTFSDFYIQIMNKLDEKLTKEGIDTKIVFSIKPNIPVKERIKKNDRITMMFCPIFRDFSQTFPDEVTEDYLEEIPVFGPNDKKIDRFFKETHRYVSLFKKWKDIYDGDTVIYDYVLIWFLYHDPGYMQCAEIIAKDMKNLKAMGLNGINSCQVQRLFFPTAMPMIAMSETLWNRDIEFEEIKNKYMTDAFGEDGPMIAEIMQRIGQKEIMEFSTSLNCCKWEKIKGEKTLSLIQKSRDAVKELEPIIEKNMKDETLPEAVKKSWEYLTYYPEHANLFLDAWQAAYGEGDLEKSKEAYAKLEDRANQLEPVLNRVFDTFLYKQRLAALFKYKVVPLIVPDPDEDE